MAMLTAPVTLRGRTASSRVLFGPHETNLAYRREISARHLAYYARRATGGAGVIVTEAASVHDSDHPYERAPLAADCGPGWAEVVRACRPHGALVLAGLGHAGGQGSTAYGPMVLWGPSRVADVASREVPMEMEQPEIDALIASFAEAAAVAVRADVDGVEVNAGQHSLLRQFLSGLTNHRVDAYGRDRDRLLREVLAAVRAELGQDRILGLRLSGDELAPWGGITPEHAAATASAVTGWVDYLVVVRGSAMSVHATRPDLHIPPGFNRGLCARIRAGVGVPVVLQGSVVDPVFAQAALDDGVADLVEMTRALITEPDLVALARAGTPERIRPCTLSNQRTAVRDTRNPILSDEAEPGAGHEVDDPPVEPADPHPMVVLAVGGGPADPDSRGVLVMGGEPAVPDPPDVLAVGGGPADADPRRAFAVGGGPSVTGPHGVLGDGGGPAGLDPRDVLVVGGGPAGLEAARVLALRGHRVRLAERGCTIGGALRLAAAIGTMERPGRPADVGRGRLALLVGWWDRELARLGVVVDTEVAIGTAELDAARRDGVVVLLATGSRPGPRPYPTDGVVLDAASFAQAVLAAGSTAAALRVLPSGPVLVHDPVGDWTGVGVAEQVAAAGRPTVIVTPDQVAGTQLARTGDLVPANARLARAGVVRELRSVAREVRGGVAVLEHVWTGERHETPCALVIDCGHRLPEDALWLTHPDVARAGDCIAPRTTYEAVLEGRRAALAISGSGPTRCPTDRR